MLSVPGVEVKARIYESANSLVYRAVRLSNQEPVILKILKENYPTPQELARYRTEYQITKSLNLPGCVKVYDLQSYQNTLIMFVEDFGGESLKIWMKQKRLGLEEFLRIAIAITASLEQLHSANIIHKDINPSNIVFNPATGRLKLIDFGIATQLTRENPTLKSPNVLEGTLAYMSPEQTGRMNRSLDYRTDFYSLGITFYELLSNRLPFNSLDALELVHCHIAKQPPPLLQINPDIPQVLSNIIMKLIAKNAEERYQSVFGIKADLENCLNQLLNSQNISKFLLATQDVSDKFQIPQKLYGREREIKILLSSFEQVSSKSELVLISGYSGIGKSAIVQELHKPVTQKCGYFVSGKFDQYQRNIPCSAVVVALRDLVKQLLTESEACLTVWRQKLLEALGINGQIIIDVIPEVELVIGKQPTVLEVGMSESQNRFNSVFLSFIKAFINPERPLILFLDDLQWADGASLKLIQVFMSSAIPGLLLIGAYRDNEVSPVHPLQLAVEKTIKAGVSVNKIELLPLDLPTITQLVSDALNCSGNEVSPLAELVFDKTGGNPFFVTEFLNSLYKKKLLNFDFTSRKWQWNVEQIRERDFTDNVVELISTKIQMLPEDIQETLRIAACIGNKFELRSLAKICQVSLRETLDCLRVAVAENIIAPLSNIGDVELAIAGKLSATQSLEYKFIHDRIQQAAYSLIDKQDKLLVHLQIGKTLLKAASINNAEANIFNIVNQLNLGCELIYCQIEKNELARLNLIAANKAKAATAYEVAFTYLQIGIRLLEKNSWLTQYDLSLKLYQEAAQIACLLGDFERLEALITLVIQNAKTELDKVKVYELKIENLTIQNNLKQGLDLGRKVLHSLGILLTESSSDLYIEVEPESLIDLPIMTDPKALAAMSVLGKMLAIGYIGIPELLKPIVLTQIELSIKYGNAPKSSFAYATYGVMLCTNDDIEAGYKYGKLSLKLVEQLDAEHIKAGVLDTFGNHIVHWKEHIKASLSILREAYCNAVETGNIDFIGYSSFDYCFNAYLLGRDLKDLEKEYIAYYETLNRIKNRTCLTWLAIYLQIICNLLGRVRTPTQLLGEFYSEEQTLPFQIESSDRQGIFLFYLNKTVLCYLFGDYNEAVRNAIFAEPYLDGVPGMAAIPLFYFYDSLAHLSIFANSSEPEKEIALKRINANQKRMQIWANHAPMNYLHKFYLVEAEKARIFDQFLEAIEHYDQAISLARKHEYVNEAALAYELAAKFYLSRGKELTARAYIQEAHYCYQLWGAVAKVKDLETRYSQLFVISQPISHGISNSISTTGSRSNSLLDVATTMKAVEAISGEIVLERLLSKLMKILIENGGAQTGYLILEEQGKLLIEAEGALESEEVTVLQSLPIENCQKLAESIVNYVARTKEKVVLGNAICEGLFTNDPYVKATQPKSILCTTLMNQGKLSAIVYLENRLTAQAFTPERLEVLQLLSGQAAIAITNAKLYTEVKERENRLHQFIDAMPIGVAVHDTTGQVTYANHAAHQLNGIYAVPQITSENFAATYQLYQAGTNQLYTASQLPHVRSSIGKTVRVEDVEIRQPDKVISLEVSSTSILDEAGQIKYAIAAFQDITDRKQAEKLLADYNRTLEQQVAERTLALQREIAERKQAEAAAQAANQAKSIFLANMSHELRTPLNAILGFAQLMNRFSSLSVQHQEYLGIISRNGEHLLTLINQVLDLSKIEAGRVSLDETDVDFYCLLNDLEAMFQFQVERKGLQLSVSRMPGVPQCLRTDETKLRQVLINLLSNAIRFTSAGGVSIRVKAEHSPLQIYFEIEDTGDGIAPEEIDSLFEAFVQTKTGEESQEGTGLGLTIARSFVRLMGGDMTVTSTLGSGTLFKFNVRANPVEAITYQKKQSSHRAIALVPGQPRYRILIADDRWDNRQLLVDILAPFGFELIEAADGVEAIQMWEKHSPALVFMDMRMPMMNGYEAIKRIKNTASHQTTVVIAVTASSFEEKAIFSSGCDDFIRKPLKQEDIFDILRKHINAQFILEDANSTLSINTDEVSMLSLSALADLPTDLLSSFQQAISNLDLKKIQTVLLQIRQIDKPLANIIETEVKNFQYEKLLDLISPLETSHE